VPGQHIENLFRRYKGEVVNVKTISGGVYSGRITEITNDYVCLSESGTESGEQVFISFTAVESVVIGATDLH
jgi:ferredoxin-fold anticodon binding domain-containing protein